MNDQSKIIDTDGCLDQTAEYALVIDVVSEQLRQTAGHVEESVMKVCQSFSSIARRTKDNALHVAQTARPSGGSDPLRTARATIERLLSRMDKVRRATEDRANQEAIETFRRLEAISSQVDTILKSVDKVDLVAQALKILALNARIEASRAGEVGNAFGVVASETGELAKVIGSTSRSVRSMVQKLWQEVKDSTERMRVELEDESSTTNVSEVAELSQEEGSRALDELARAHADMQVQIQQAASNSKQLAEDISDAMTALQFQDAVSQQIDHMIAALQDTRDALCGGQSLDPEELLHRLRSRSTMQSERQLVDQLTDTRAHRICAEENAIELF